jgi:hypothetical protein
MPVVTWASKLLLLAFLTTMVSENFAHAKPCPQGLRLQQISQQRNAWVQVARLHALGGNAEKYIAATSKLNQLTIQQTVAFLEQEIRNFSLIGNVGCLMAAMRGASGQNLSWQPYTDGKLDLIKRWSGYQKKNIGS